MTSGSYPFAQPTFGKRLTPPPTAEQQAQAAVLARDAERRAMMARTEAYLEAHWEESLADAWGALKGAEDAMARRRLGTMGGGVMQGLVGFAVGMRAGR